jgi:arginyl-tRNA synthetase
MNIFKTYKNKIDAIAKELSSDLSDAIIKNITAEPPKDKSHGDIASNAAIILAKPLQKSPKEIAEIISTKLKSDDLVEKIDIAGAGFINIKLKNAAWYQVLKNVLSEQKSYGAGNYGNNQKINLEYVSANPTGPMHIGHARNAVIGDVLARLLIKAGFNVTKEYYINDAGAQVEVLAKSAFLRYKEALGENIGEIPAGLYPGEYLIDIAKDFAKIHGDKFKNSTTPPEEIKEFCLVEILKLIKGDLASLGVYHDVFTSEKSLHKANMIEKSVEYLNSHGHIYRGILEPPKGKTPDDWEPREQTLFRSTSFGDDVDRPIQKSSGEYTYFAGDIAYHKDKIDRGFNNMVIVLGADHGGYVKRLQAVVKSLSENAANIKVLLSQLVNLTEDGVVVKMSKRSGNFVTLREVVDEVSAGVVRFMMLTRRPDAVIDFDLKKVKEQSKDNPVFYVQYAHARIKSAIRNAGIAVDGNADFSLISHPAEISLMQKIAELPRVVELAAIHMEPHRIAFYVTELAGEFHSLYNLGKDEDLKFIVENNAELTKARLNLIQACAYTIAAALDIMGIDAVEKM